MIAVDSRAKLKEKNQEEKNSAVFKIKSRTGMTLEEKMNAERNRKEQKRIERGTSS